MAHRHECRYCEEIYLCPEDADECFQTYIVCQECWWDHDFRQCLLFVLLLLIALGATLYLSTQYEDAKRPALPAPVFSTGIKTTTGENYYENETKTNHAG